MTLFDLPVYALMIMVQAIPMVGFINSYPEHPRRYSLLPTRVTAPLWLYPAGMPNHIVTYKYGKDGYSQSLLWMVLD